MHEQHVSLTCVQLVLSQKEAANTEDVDACRSRLVFSNGEGGPSGEGAMILYQATLAYNVQCMATTSALTRWQATEILAKTIRVAKEEALSRDPGSAVYASLQR